MRVLWFSVTPSRYNSDTLYGGWVASLEDLLTAKYKDLKLGIAFEHTDRCFKQLRGNVTYYPINKYNGWRDKLYEKLHFSYNWKLLKPHILQIISDFNPDIIHCFGSEWPFGLIAEDTDIPVVIHMQGFLNIYSLSSEMVCRPIDQFAFHHYNPLVYLQYRFRQYKSVQSNAQERKIMYINKYFMGRTEWDRNIVKYYSPGAQYFHCEEAIRPVFMNTQKRWHFVKRDKLKLVTISSASTLKGNDLILRTAKVLTEMGVDFEWRVAGGKDSFKLCEYMLNLKHGDLHINLLGRISAEEIINELADSEFYVHTAIIDNSPNSLCEAQLIGCPVVATNVGGIPQLVTNGETGYLYPYNEPNSLVFILLNLHGDKEHLERISENEIKIALERHNKEKIANSVFSIYSKITSER